MLISPLNAFPWVLNGLIEAWVSLKRVQSFLQMEELDLSAYYTLPLHASDGKHCYWLEQHIYLILLNINVISASDSLDLLII